jgi:hypothetical protein
MGPAHMVEPSGALVTRRPTSGSARFTKGGRFFKFYRREQADRGKTGPQAVNLSPRRNQFIRSMVACLSEYLIQNSLYQILNS